MSERTVSRLTYAGLFAFALFCVAVVTVHPFLP